MLLIKLATVFLCASFGGSTNVWLTERKVVASLNQQKHVILTCNAEDCDKECAFTWKRNDDVEMNNDSYLVIDYGRSLIIKQPITKKYEAQYICAVKKEGDLVGAASSQLEVSDVNPLAGREESIKDVNPLAGREESIKELQSIVEQINVPQNIALYVVLGVFMVIMTATWLCALHFCLKRKGLNGFDVESLKMQMNKLNKGMPPLKKRFKKETSNSDRSSEGGSTTESDDVTDEESEKSLDEGDESEDIVSEDESEDTPEQPELIKFVEDPMKSKRVEYNTEKKSSKRVEGPKGTKLIKPIRPHEKPTQEKGVRKPGKNPIEMKKVALQPQDRQNDGKNQSKRSAHKSLAGRSSPNRNAGSPRTHGNKTKQQQN